MSLILLLLQQEGPSPVEVPNAMAAHTWFVVLAIGAFLMWSISYALQLQKEAMERRKGRENLTRRKKELLDQIVNLEERKEAGNITDHRYRQDLKELKFRLSKVLERLSPLPP